MWQWISTRDWQFINSFADWFSALGTIAAVIVALYLSSRDQRIRLKVNAGIRMVFTEGRNTNSRDKYINISVTNIGRRTARVNSLLFKPVPFKKTALWLNPPRNTLSADFPITLRDSETADYLMPLEEYKAVNIKRAMYIGRFPKLAARFTKIVVCTSTGKRCSSKIERELGDWFLSAGLYRKPVKTSSVGDKSA